MKNNNSSDGPLLSQSISLAIEIIELFKELSYKKNEYVMSKQILRSATSVGANVTEANNAESQKDFVHKLSISQKECAETLYWLHLLMETKFIHEEKYKVLKSKSE